MEELGEQAGSPTNSSNPRGSAGRLSGALAGAFERHRDEYNGRFAAARRANRHLRNDDFSAHLIENLAPMIDAVEGLKAGEDGAQAAADGASSNQGTIDTASRELFELSCQLVARKRVGPQARFLLINRLWREFLPEMARFWVNTPRETVQALTRAAYALAEIDTQKAERWVQALAKIAPACSDTRRLLDAGKVLAWRVGMAHFRESALDIWRGLPDDLRYRTLYLEEDVAEVTADPDSFFHLEVLDAALANPWFDPRRALANFSQNNPDQPKKSEISSDIRQIDGFIGFGGHFSTPPRVFSQNAQLYACDGRACFAVYADVFGAVLMRASVESTFKNDSAQRPDELSSSAAIRWTRAFTRPHSHRIFVHYHDARLDGAGW